MTDIETLRMAAIAAVLAASSSRADPSQSGRNLGESWAQDHRRMNMGLSSLMQRRSSRSPWR
ncbi:MAG: hypothetical protein CMB76_03620 [Euryarchaeota archaeon]|nr:hypothetical protein [Euryarchaeota archaeon]